MKRTLIFFLTFLTAFLTLLGFLVAEASSQPVMYTEASGNYLVYLPLVVQSDANNPSPSPTPPSPTPTPTATPPPDVSVNAFFVDDHYRSNSAAIQVDANGGMHVAYAYYEAANDDAPTYGVYLYCASDCMNFDNWGGVSMGELVSEIQLELTPSGSPRILYRSFGSSNSNDFFYATCDEDCTNPVAWNVAWVTNNQGTAILELNDDTLPQRYFALDPQGNPRFVYVDYNYQANPDHIGTYYMFCDNTCTTTASWQEVRINQDNGNPSNYRDEDLYYPVLAFTPQGFPRVATAGSSMDDEFFLFYLACDIGCEDIGNWTTVPLMDRGSGPSVSYDLETDTQGRPRIAFYQGSLSENQGDRLSYLWCNSNCLNPGNWQSKDLGLGANNGRGPDLELTTNNLPRMAYAWYDEGGMGYSWCNANCESTSAVWQDQIVETGEELLAAWEVDFPPHCDAGFWDGLTPVLALDGEGNPYLAYDAAYHARCWYNPVTGDWDPQSVFHLIWRVVRVNYFSQP